MPKLDSYLFREFAQTTFAALVVLMIVSLGMQGGLWGLCQKLWQLVRGKKSNEGDGTAAQADAKGGHA